MTMNDDVICSNIVVEEAIRPSLKVGDNVEGAGYFITKNFMNPGWELITRKPESNRNCLTCDLECPLKGVERS